MRPRLSDGRRGERASFLEVVGLIRQTRLSALQAVNTALIDLYWRIGAYISLKLESSAWGERVVERLARFIARHHPDLKGFTRSNLFRMRQLYEIYRDDEKVAALARQLTWTHNLIILARCKRAQERDFYLRLCVRENWGTRELERQLAGGLFERVALSPPAISARLKDAHPAAETVFRDSYLLDFLSLPDRHSERDLRRALVANLHQFLMELGTDFCFLGEEFRVQVGSRDFCVDLLFFNRALNCLVAFELKIDEFQPEYLGKLEFYLEALDRDVRKAHEGPSIGVLLCATKDREVVEYALSRSLSPALVAEYQTRLPDRKLLQAKLHEFYLLAEPRRS